MKHIGIAAVTAEGAALVYRRICSTAGERLGRYRHPEISMHSFPFSEHIEAGPRPHEKWADLLLASAKKLQASGADFMICPSNTPHEVYDQVSSKLNFPWLHIAEATGESAARKSMRRLLLLGTRFTLEGSVYDHRVFSENGIELVLPEEAEINLGAVLGCTELPLAIDPINSHLPLVDSVVALADAAVGFALGSGRA